MSDDKQAIIDKIMKCLALSKSSNEHEAAAALRQAQKLMEQHGVSDFDIETADIREAQTRASASSKPTLWESALARRVAAAFGCKLIFSADYFNSTGHWKFIGVVPSHEIATYAMTVLLRQAKKARAEHIKNALRRCGPKTKTRRADLYCEGWVSAATGLLASFSGSEENKVRLLQYVAEKYNTTRQEPKDRSAGKSLTDRDHGDLGAGARAGRNAQLNRGVGADDAPLALE